MQADEPSGYILKHVEEVLSKDYSAETNELINLIVKSNKVFIYGVGRSGLIGKAFAIRLVQMGLKVFFIGETITPIVEANDTVLIVSNIGETMSAVQTANIARRVGAKVIAITSKENSKLAHAANLVICLKPRSDEKIKRLAPLGTLFEVAAFLYFDGVVARIMENLKKSEEDMRKRHAIWV